ncbi:hypothetical protein PFISCL1PPCAC_13860, partial [Pristionchus fissidentatus]
AKARKIKSGDMVKIYLDKGYSPEDALDIVRGKMRMERKARRERRRMEDRDTDEDEELEDEEEDEDR